MLNPITKKDLGSLREEIRTCTRLKEYLESSLARIDTEIRTAQAPDLQWLQGGAQCLSELLDTLDNQSPY